MNAISVSLVVAMGLLGRIAVGEQTPQAGARDQRICTALYNADEVYRLRGQVGYQIDLQFEAGETFVGLAAGDLEGLSFVAQGNHLFLKPKAVHVDTNLTVLTTRRHYQFSYVATNQPSRAGDLQLIYALAFIYPAASGKPSVDMDAAEQRLDSEAPSVRNLNFWYCGSPVLKPIAAFDDGAQTHLRFDSRAELPAIFVRNDDDSESLLNFSVEGSDVVIQRIARQFVVRRGRLVGCIVNRGYSGSGTRLDSGTVDPAVLRAVQGRSK